MRVLYIANIRLPTPRAHGVQIMKTCEALSEAGAEVTLYISTRSGDRDNKDPFTFYNVKKNFLIKRVWVPGFSSYSPGYWFYIRSLFFTLRVFFATLFEGNYIVYSRDKISLIPYVLFTKRKVFYESHGDDTGGRAAFVLKRVSGIICIAKSLKELHVSAGVPAQRVAVIPDAADLALFDSAGDKNYYRTATNLPLNKKIIMYFGSFFFYSWKGVDIFLETAQYRKDLLFVAAGGLDEEVIDLKTRFPAENILLRGRVPYKEMPLYLKSADVLVIPNKKGNLVSERYTSPMKLFDYMASGIPIIASDLPSLREILTDSNATFFTADNPVNLGEVIGQVLDNPEASEEKAKVAKKDVGNYTWSSRAEKIKQFIQNTNV